MMAFSGHRDKTMMHTLEAGSTISAKLRRDQGLNCHFIFNSRVHILHSLLSNMKIEESQ